MKPRRVAHTARPQARAPAELVQAALATPAQPLPATTRTFFEPAFARSFATVPTRAAPAGPALALDPDPAAEREAQSVEREVSRGVSRGASRFGESPPGAGKRDLSTVRIHHGPRAGAFAEALGAHAFTVGRDIVFAPGRFAPETSPGRALLAHELTHVAQQTTSGPAVQRAGKSFGGFFSNLLNRVLGIFGTSTFLESGNREYLAEREKTGAIENDFDSDLRARDIADHHTTYEPLSVKVKTLLVREMLNGWTTLGDENAIITLFRASTSADRQAMAQGVGRDELWDNFSFGNRRTIEALTLTAADFNNPALRRKYENLDAGDLADYIANATDPAVKAGFEKLTAFKKITTPVGLDAELGPGGSARYEIHGMDVLVLPDKRDATLKVGKGETGFAEVVLPTKLKYETTNGQVSKFEPLPKIVLKLQTSYLPDVDPDAPPPKTTYSSDGAGGFSSRSTGPGGVGYGRGTTAEDIAAGRTTLRFHESRHGLDHLAFLRAHSPPQFTGKVGMAEADFLASWEAYPKAWESYLNDLVKDSIRRTDCPGIPIPAEILQKMDKLHLKATFCTDPP